jgi:uncharacterized protein (UPF0210 family)
VNPTNANDNIKAKKFFIRTISINFNLYKNLHGNYATLIAYLKHKIVNKCVFFIY